MSFGSTRVLTCSFAFGRTCWTTGGGRPKTARGNSAPLWGPRSRRTHRRRSSRDAACVEARVSTKGI
jgi:hypothetical protein